MVPLHRGRFLVVKGKKGKGLDTCYSTTYTSQTRDQQRFTISEVQLIGMSQCAPVFKFLYGPLDFFLGANLCQKLLILVAVRTHF